MQLFTRLFVLSIKPQSIILFVFVILIAYFGLDQRLAQWLIGVDLLSITPILEVVSVFGESFLYLILFLLCGLYFRYIRKISLWENRSWFLGLSVLIPILISGALKILLGRARPVMWITGKYYGFYGPHVDHNFWSFPSGHTSAVMGLAFGISIVFPRYGVLWIFAGLLVASTRIFLLQHYLSDVLAAGYFALLEVGLLFCWLKTRSWANCVNIEQKLVNT